MYVFFNPLNINRVTYRTESAKYHVLFRGSLHPKGKRAGSHQPEMEFFKLPRTFKFKKGPVKLSLERDR